MSKVSRRVLVSIFIVAVLNIKFLRYSIPTTRCFVRRQYILWMVIVLLNPTYSTKKRGTQKYNQLSLRAAPCICALIGRGLQYGLLWNCSFHSCNRAIPYCSHSLLLNQYVTALMLRHNTDVYMHTVRYCRVSFCFIVFLVDLNTPRYWPVNQDIQRLSLTETN